MAACLRQPQELAWLLVQVCHFLALLLELRVDPKNTPASDVLLAQYSVQRPKGKRHDERLAASSWQRRQRRRTEDPMTTADLSSPWYRLCRYRHLLPYLLEAQTVLRGARYLSLTTDASRTGRRELLFICLLDNLQGVAAWAPCEVPRTGWMHPSRVFPDQGQT